MPHPSTAPSQQPVIDAMSSSTRLLAGCLLASVALHVVVALGLPGWWNSVPPQILPVMDVVLMPETVAAPAKPVPPELPPVNPRAKTAAAAPSTRTVSVTAASTEIAVPPSTTETTVSPVAESARAPAVAPPAPSIAPRAEQAVTPPLFNAAYLRNPPPRYPLAARRNSEEGTVVLRVLVTADGAASRTELDLSSGSTSLDSAAMEAVRSWRFVPARRGAQNIEDWVRVPVVFRLES